MIAGSGGESEKNACNPEYTQQSKERRSKSINRSFVNFYGFESTQAAEGQAVCCRNTDTITFFECVKNSCSSDRSAIGAHGRKRLVI